MVGTHIALGEGDLPRPLVVYATQKVQEQLENIVGERNGEVGKLGLWSQGSVRRKAVKHNQKTPSLLENGLSYVKELRQPGNRLF